MDINLLKSKREDLKTSLIASLRDADGKELEVISKDVREAFENIEKEISDMTAQIEVAERAEAIEKENARQVIEKMDNITIVKSDTPTFDLGKAVREMSLGKGLTGFEAEHIAKRSDESGISTDQHSMILSARDFDSTAGANFKETSKNEQLSISQYPNIMDSIGVSIINGLNGDYDLHSAAEHVNAVKVAEDIAVTGGFSTPAKVTLSVNRFGWTDIVTKENMAKMNSALFASLWEDAQKSINRKMEAELIDVLVAGITAEVGYTGVDADFDRADMLVFEGLIKSPYNLKWLTDRTIYAAWRGKIVDAGSGKFLVNGAPDKGVSDTGVPVLTSGYGAAALAKTAYLGDFSEVFVGNWGEAGSYEIITNPYTYATKGKIELVINRLSDIKVRNTDFIKGADNIVVT